MGTSGNRKELRAYLDSLYEKYNESRWLSSDPVEFTHRYRGSAAVPDLEAAGLLAAMLAYGGVKQIRASVSKALDRLNGLSPAGPAAFVRLLAAEPGLGEGRERLKDWVHRFHRGDDLILLLRLLGRSWREHGTLGGHFQARLVSGDTDIGGALARVLGEWAGWAREWGARPGEPFPLSGFSRKGELLQEMVHVPPVDGPARPD